jgi:hypothetical protein
MPMRLRTLCQSRVVLFSSAGRQQYPPHRRHWFFFRLKPYTMEQQALQPHSQPGLADRSKGRAGLLAWSRIFGRWRPARIASRNDLARFLDQRAALVAQQSVVGYCHVKTGLTLKDLNCEPEFASAFEYSRWEAYTAVLADFVILAEGRLRRAAGDRAAELVGGLTDLFAAVLAGHEPPAHRSAGWSAEIAALRERLARAQLADPLPAVKVGEVSAGRLYETLPIHPDLRVRDKPALIANVQFRLLSQSDEFDRRLDADAVVADLIGPARKGAA